MLIFTQDKHIRSFHCYVRTEVFISRYFISCFRVNASKQFTQGLGDQVCVLGLFGGESRIVGREGGFKAGAEKLAKFIG